MTSDYTGGVKWRQATVLIRGDIFSLAQEQGIDISSECNRALADKLGIEFAQQKIPEMPRESPVIVAKDGAAGSVRDGKGPRQLHPVINAEDPSTPSHILRAKKEPPVRTKPAPASAPVPEPAADENAAEGPVVRTSKPVKAADVRPLMEKSAKDASKGKGRDDLIRQFIVKRVARTDPGDGENRIARDELYQVFTRWWKSNAGKSATIPDKRAFTVCLKNRLVMEETVVDSVQYWNNVKLR